MSKKTESKEILNGKTSIPGYTSIEEFTKDGFKHLMEAIKHANALPIGNDWNFYTTYQSFNKLLNNENNQIIKSINNILKTYNIDGLIKPKSINNGIELIIDANDTILDKTANHLDELNGIKKSIQEPIVLQTVNAQKSINESWNKAEITLIDSAINRKHENANSITLLTAKNIVRPQTYFQDKIDNRNDVPWMPRIKDKPNSLKPLALYLEEYDDRQEYSHPYEFELEKFTVPNAQLAEEPCQTPKPLADTPMIEINAPEQLPELLDALRGQQVIGVDVEHHSYRTFMGITCLLQISTSNCDYIIDTLTLRNDLHQLNEIFTNTKILKIFHGADKDIEWLQRDLSVYVINMFDTYQAAKLMNFSQLSLNYLMQKFVNLQLDKQYQLADWRIRPLPEEMKLYARQDTHYLIYIYQKLKQELFARNNGKTNLLAIVYELSTETCQKRYFKPLLTDDSHMELYTKSHRLFDNRQLYALKHLYEWRDKLAREEDESLGYILPNHMLIQIAEILPREMQGILACCNPVPPLIRANLNELHQIILAARDQPLVKPILMPDTRAKGSINLNRIDVNNPLNCPHDLTKSCEFRDDLPVLLGNNLNRNLINSNIDIEMNQSIYTIFNSDSIYIQDQQKISETIKLPKVLTPFERYKYVKPFVENMDKIKEIPANENTERIEEIHRHFLAMAEQFRLNQTEEIDTKKRKRDHSEESVSKTAKLKRKRSKNKSGTLAEQKRQELHPLKHQRQPPNIDQAPIVDFSEDIDIDGSFQSFDYSTVDYNQFQGGGQNAIKPQPIRMNFKAKKQQKTRNRNQFTYRGRGKKF